MAHDTEEWTSDIFPWVILQIENITSIHGLSFLNENEESIPSVGLIQITICLFKTIDIVAK